MTILNMAQAINEALAQALEENPDVVVLGEDVAVTGGVFRVTDGLYERFGAGRVIDTPVAESGIVGVGLGMAIAGLRPIVELQFMGFSYPAYDQLISHVSRIRSRSRGRFTAPMVIRVPYGGGIGAAEHHSESAEASYAHIPGLKVVVPSSAASAKGLLLNAIDDPDPVLFLEPIRLYRAARDEVSNHASPLPFGQLEVVRSGDDVTLIAYGSMIRESVLAAEKLAEERVDVEVLDLRSLVPLDANGVIASVEKTGRVVIVQEAPRTAGFAAELVAQIQERALYVLEGPILRVTGWDTVFPLKRNEDNYLPTPERIASAVRRALAA